MSGPLQVTVDDATGQVGSVRLYGRELLDPARPCASELLVNGRALALRPHVDPHDPTRRLAHLKGERWVDHFAGWSLVVARTMGERHGTAHGCFGIQTLVRRELCDQTLPCPGPGGPPIEAPLWIDTLTTMAWNWRFWGDDTRMVFASTHANGPADEQGHVGYEHDTPEACKRFLQNAWRRVYPGCMLIHGGLFYDARTGQWIAITCRRPGVGYLLNIEDAGRGVAYDFTLHARFDPGESLQLPEVVLSYGDSADGMWRWLADYVRLYQRPAPAWVGRTVWAPGLAWNNQPTWREQGEQWERELVRGPCTGFSYSLVTDRPVRSGTTPKSYRPDPNHGSVDEFRAMCRRIAARGAPLLVWMSHSGLLWRGSDDIDDDWFIRGIDGRTCASWGSIDQGELTHINPGHPGYIEYTKRWIRFYIEECGAKGIFFDCLSWAFPPDFVPRPWMRYPGDTNRMAIRFIEEIHAFIRRLDPEAIMLGEGATLDAPIDVMAIVANPVRSIDGMGPRDFLLSLGRWGTRLTIDQGPRLFPASGYCVAIGRPETEALDRHVGELVRRHGATAFTPLPGDLSVLDDVVVVPAAEDLAPRPVELSGQWRDVVELRDELSGAVVACASPGRFAAVRPGVYRMARAT